MLLGLAACLLVSGLVDSGNPASYKLAGQDARYNLALQGNPMRELIERYESDRSALARFFPISISPGRAERFKKLYADTRSDLNGVNFGGLDADGKLDWVLTENMLTYNERRLELDEKERLDAIPFVPFEKDVIEMAEARQRMEKVDGQAAAARLDKIRDTIAEKQKALEKDLADKKKFEKPVIFRAAAFTDQLRGHLREWFEFYKGYDPIFRFWISIVSRMADRLGRLQPLPPSFHVLR